MTRSWSDAGTQSQGSAYIPDYMYVEPFSMLPYGKETARNICVKATPALEALLWIRPYNRAIRSVWQVAYQGYSGSG